MAIDLDGRAAIVTGGSRGLGRQMAEALIAAGGRVAIMTPEADELKATLAEIEAASGPGKAIGLPYDITRFEQCERAVAETIDAFGGVEVLVNNAALGQLSVLGPDADTVLIEFFKADPAAWVRVIEVNFIGAFNMCRAVAPHMIDRRFGRIVNINTSIGSIQRPGNSPYGPAKGALEAMTMIFAGDLEGTGVTCNSLLPGGAARTTMVPRSFHENRPLVDPAVMRAPIVWLASDASGAHTGERYVAENWDPALPPEEAAAKALEPPVYRPPDAAHEAKFRPPSGG